MEGWICPKCGRCYNPAISECYRCQPNTVASPITVWPLTVGPIGCTCGSSAGTGVCPIHGGTVSSSGHPSAFGYTAGGAN